jgi:hypothetical protein
MRARPDGPPIITSRASLSVGAINPMRRQPAAICVLIHSAPARVFPAPRPPRNSQTFQLPSGGICSDRAQKGQS